MIESGEKKEMIISKEALETMQFTEMKTTTSYLERMDATDSLEVPVMIISQEEKATTSFLETLAMIPSEEMKATTLFMVTMEMIQSKETTAMTRLEATMEKTRLWEVQERIYCLEEMKMTF